jgi:hypothetical protein
VALVALLKLCQVCCDPRRGQDKPVFVHKLVVLSLIEVLKARRRNFAGGLFNRMPVQRLTRPRLISKAFCSGVVKGSLTLFGEKSSAPGCQAFEIRSDCRCWIAWGSCSGENLHVAKGSVAPTPNPVAPPSRGHSPPQAVGYIPS